LKLRLGIKIKKATGALTQKTLSGGIRDIGITAIAVVSSAGLAFAALFVLFFKLISLQLHGLATITLLAGTLVLIALALTSWTRLAYRRVSDLEYAAAKADEARRSAEATAIEKARLLATMSHEIRTPLNGVIGMVNLMLETELSAEQRNYADMAHSSSRTLLSIIDEILDHAKSDATNKGEKAPFDPRHLIESASELLAARAIGKDIDVSAHVSPDVPQHLTTGEMALRQIVFNLAGNAIKFTERGSVGIELTVTEPGWLCLSVSDTGIGLTPEQLAQVFNDYEQASPQTARRFGGTGLGLGIVKSLVERQGGHLRVTSVPGQGSIFSAHLPVSESAMTAVPQPLAGRTIHLAMADSISRRHLEQSVSELGGTVQILEGNEVLQSAFATSDAMLIVDTSHAEAMRQWAAAPSRSKRGNVWFMLKPEERRSHRDLLTQPVAGYLLKPLRHQTLLSRVAGADAAALAETAKTLRSASRKSKAVQALTVLVADDNPVNLILTKTMLAKAGHTVTTAVNGEDVLAKLAVNSAYDLLLLDVEMPVLNGHEAAMAIRANEIANGFARLPILGLTAHARPEELQKCITSGMDDYLSKPFDSEDLSEMIAKLARKIAA
jgi:signal transduction histidine kinase/CheY-like chemotaxis protein